MVGSRLRTALALLATLAPCAISAAHAGPALLFEAKSGKVLYAEDPDNLWHPASLTKIMTAYVTFEAIKAGKLTLAAKIPCSEAAHVQAPSKVGLPVGAEMTVEVALQALIVKSANDVAVMLAEAVGGTEAGFVEMMNATAKRLGMSRTRFVNANGLPAVEQVTTARDLAKLSRAVVRDFPEYGHYWSMTEVKIGKQRLGSHNSLLKTFEGADGLKTGFICDSGYNVVASASRDGQRLMAVVLGEPSGHQRALRAASLLEHGFQQQGWKQIFNATDIDNMSVSPDAKGISNMRSTVLKWDCGGRPRAQAVAKANKIKSRTAKLKAAAGAAQPKKAVAGTAQGGKQQPAAGSSEATAKPKKTKAVSAQKAPAQAAPTAKQ